MVLLPRRLYYAHYLTLSFILIRCLHYEWIFVIREFFFNLLGVLWRRHKALNYSVGACVEHQLRVPSSASGCRGRKSSRSHSTEKPPAPDSGPPDDKAGHPSSADRPPHVLNGINQVVTQTVVIYFKICSVMGVLEAERGRRTQFNPSGPVGLLWLPYPPARILFNPSVPVRPPLHQVPTLSSTPGARRSEGWRGRGRHQQDVEGASEGCATLRWKP